MRPIPSAGMQILLRGQQCKDKQDVFPLNCETQWPRIRTQTAISTMNPLDNPVILKQLPLGVETDRADKYPNCFLY